MTDTTTIRDPHDIKAGERYAAYDEKANMWFNHIAKNDFNHPYAFRILTDMKEIAEGIRIVHIGNGREGVVEARPRLCIRWDNGGYSDLANLDGVIAIIETPEFDGVRLKKENLYVHSDDKNRISIDTLNDGECLIWLSFEGASQLVEAIKQVLKNAQR